MEDLSVLGNAAAVPIVITITQLLKSNFKIKHGSELLSLAASLIVCSGWTLYTMDESFFYTLAAANFLTKFKWGVGQLVIGFATWLSASKLYDLGYGSKKKQAKVEAEKKEIFKGHVEEKEKLQEEVIKLKKNFNGGLDEPMEHNSEISAKLEEILGER